MKIFNKEPEEIIKDRMNWEAELDEEIELYNLAVRIESVK